MTESFFTRTPKIHTVAQMQEKLAERSQRALSATEPMKLKWMDPVNTGNGTAYQLSECGTYSVCRVRVAGGLQYEAWMRSPLQMRLVIVKSAEEGRAMCQQRADNP